MRVITFGTLGQVLKLSVGMAAGKMEKNGERTEKVILLSVAFCAVFGHISHNPKGWIELSSNRSIKPNHSAI